MISSRTVVIALGLPLLSAIAVSQDGRNIKAGETQTVEIMMLAGDYISGAVDQQSGVVFASAANPEGVLIRPFAGPLSGRREFSFVAETNGTYKLNLRAPTIEQAAQNGIKQPEVGRYTLLLGEKISAAERLKPVETRPRYRSPIIEQLQVETSKGASTDAFWERLRTAGTPIVEPFPGDARYQLVTFVWRGAPQVHNVLVLGSFSSNEFIENTPSDYFMRRLGTTDVWHLTLKLPASAQFTYRLSPNDRADQRSATLQADPLNANRSPNGPNRNRFLSVSIARLPGARSQPWIARDSNVPAGKIERLVVSGRNIAIYTPPGYAQTATENSLLVLFDGDIYSSADMMAPTILDNLIRAGKIRPTVAAFVSNPEESRAKELLGNRQFVDVVARELVPWIHSKYRVSSDPRHNVVGGMSAGGVAAALTGLNYSAVFGKILCQSPAFDWSPDHPQYGPASDSVNEPGELARLFIASPILPLEFYMDPGTFEVDLIGSGGFILEPTRHMRDVLLAKGYVVHYQQFVGGHEWLSSRVTLPDALMTLLKGNGD